MALVYGPGHVEHRHQSGSHQAAETVTVTSIRPPGSIWAGAQQTGIVRDLDEPATDFPGLEPHNLVVERTRSLNRERQIRMSIHRNGGFWLHCRQHRSEDSDLRLHIDGASSSHMSLATQPRNSSATRPDVDRLAFWQWEMTGEEWEWRTGDHLLGWLCPVHLI